MKRNKIISLIVAAAMAVGVTANMAFAKSEDPAIGLAETAKTDILGTDDMFQYHYSGGTDEYNSGISMSGKCYDVYLWVPPSVSSDELRGLVAVKMNLIEILFVYSTALKSALEKENFGILFIVTQKDSIPSYYSGDGQSYNNIFQEMYTDTDYAGNPLYTEDKYKTWDGKDGGEIFDEMLGGIAEASGYGEIADNTPIITIGHSAASPFGYRSGNWNYDRVIAQIQLKNGMGAPDYVSNKGMVPGIPSLQYAAQYTEHAMGADRDRSVRDARWHIANQRSKNTDMLVSHIIEWGSGHYDWSENATEILIKYIQKAIDYRLPDSFTGGEEDYTLADLTDTGYLAKPFEKAADGSEQAAGYYQENGWLSSGKDNSAATESEKQSSFWFFDEELEKEINEFTEYAIPESPDSTGTGVKGKTYSDIEPFMLMSDPTKSTYADTPAIGSDTISPYLSFASNPFSRYGSTRFVNYEKLANPAGNSGNAANLGGYDTMTVDTYYMEKIPSIASSDGRSAYDGSGSTVKFPANTKAELIPLMAPYELVSSELIDMSTMTEDGENAEAENVGAVIRNTLRFHNNRVYYRSGCAKTNEYGSTQDSFAMIYSPEVRDADGNVISAFKSTGVQMNVPYVTKGSQTLTLNNIENICINDYTSNPLIDVSYTSSDADLQKYTDVFVEYGPAKAVRSVDPETGAYSWQIEVLLDQIPENAQYPIEVNVVASNLGKWENVAGATASTVFYISDEEIPSGVRVDGIAADNYDAAINTALADDNAHNVSVYSDSETAQRSNLDSSENITITNGDYKAVVTQTSSNMMFLSTSGAVSPSLSFGKQDKATTNENTSLVFNANSKGRFIEVNKGTVNVYNDTVITGGTAARGGGIDVKSGSTVNIYGGIIRGNTATNSNSTNLGGGGVSAVGSGILNMSGGSITGNTAEDDLGGGVSVTENSVFNMSGGTISGNTGYDVYVNGSKGAKFNMSGSAYAGNVYLADSKINVTDKFTTSGTHAVITPSEYTEGFVVAEYASGLTPSKNDFELAKDGETEYYLKADGQNLVITATAPQTYEITDTQNIVSEEKSEEGTEITVTGADIADNSVVVYDTTNNAPVTVTKTDDGKYTFIMPSGNVEVTALINTDECRYIVASQSVRVNDSSNTDKNNYYVKDGLGLGMSFTVPEDEKTIKSASLYFTRQNTAAPQLTNIYITDEYTYNNGAGYVMQYNGGTINGAELSGIKTAGEYKLMFTYDSSVAEGVSGNDYYVVGSTAANHLAKTASQLPYIKITYAVSRRISTEGVKADKETAVDGESVTLTAPDGMVDNSLVISYLDSDGKTANAGYIDNGNGTFTFEMPSADVVATCLVNNDENKLVIVGENSSYYARHQADKEPENVDVVFEIPAIPEGMECDLANITVPARANTWNATDMRASINGQVYNLDSADVNINVSDEYINAGMENTLIISNENTSGVDYYHMSSGHYPENAGDLSVMTINLRKIPVVTDEPSETEEPGETDEPSETEEPGETDEPSETEEPEKPDMNAVTDNDILVSVNITGVSDYEDTILYTAQYDENGVLIGLNAIDVTGNGTYVIDSDMSKSDKVRLYLWSGMDPIISKIIKESAN